MNRKSYSSDLTDLQWLMLQEYLREGMHGLLYQLRFGCACRDLPHDLPSYGTVYGKYDAYTGHPDDPAAQPLSYKKLDQLVLNRLLGVR